MELTLIRQSCEEILPLLTGIIRTSSRNTGDKSDFIVLSAEEDRARFHINSGSETLEVDLEAKVKEQGSTFIPLGKFSTIITNSSTEELNIKSHNTSSGGVGIKITGTNLTFSSPVKFLEFLPEPWKAPELEMPIPVNALRALLQRVKPALVADSGPAFQSIRLVFRPGQVWAVAASNHKVAGASFKNEMLLNNTDVLIPVQFLSSIDKVLANMDDTVYLGTGNKISIGSPNIRYSTLAATQGPPAVAALFKTEGMNSIEVDSAEFIHAIKLAGASINSDGYAVIGFTKDGLEIGGGDDGVTATKIVGDVNTENELIQGFRVDYLEDAIGKYGKVRINFGKTEMDRAVFEYLEDPYMTKFIAAPARINNA